MDTPIRSAIAIGTCSSQDEIKDEETSGIDDLRWWGEGGGRKQRGLQQPAVVNKKVRFILSYNSSGS